MSRHARFALVGRPNVMARPPPRPSRSSTTGSELPGSERGRFAAERARRRDGAPATGLSAGSPYWRTRAAGGGRAVREAAVAACRAGAPRAEVPGSVENLERGANAPPKEAAIAAECRPETVAGGGRSGRPGGLVGTPPAGVMCGRPTSAVGRILPACRGTTSPALLGSSRLHPVRRPRRPWAVNAVDRMVSDVGEVDCKTFVDRQYPGLDSERRTGIAKPTRSS